MKTQIPIHVLYIQLSYILDSKLLLILFSITEVKDLFLNPNTVSQEIKFFCSYFVNWSVTGCIFNEFKKKFLFHFHSLSRCKTRVERFSESTVIHILRNVGNTLY